MIIKKLKIIFTRVRNVLKTNHKPILVVLFEIMYWRIVNSAGINFYFDYQLFLKGKNPYDYLKSYQFKRVEKELNTPEYYPILEDKYFFHQVLVGQGFRIPECLYMIDESSIFNMETKVFISKEEFIKHDFDGFCKLINGFGGKMIFQVNILNKKLKLNEKEMSVDDFFNFIGNRKYLIQKRITQHKDMNVLNPSCVNTLRMLTLRVGQNVYLFQAYLRIGINGNYVDNGISGNIMVGIQEGTGKLMEYAHSSGIDHIQYTMVKHPQTHVVFKDFNIPFYQESIEMVKSLHVLFQQFFMIGWDIGITPSGPIVIEGNNITTLYPFQVIYGGMKSSFFKYVKEYQNQLTTSTQSSS